MKNIIAENFLRFAPKNLSDADLRKIQRLSEQEDTNKPDAESEPVSLTLKNIVPILPTNFPRALKGGFGPRAIGLTATEVAVGVYRMVKATFNHKAPLLALSTSTDSGYTNLQLGTDGFGVTVSDDGKCYVFRGAAENDYFVLGNEVTGDIATPASTNKLVCYRFSVLNSEAEASTVTYKSAVYFNNSFKDACKSIVNLKLANTEESVAREILNLLVNNNTIIPPYKNANEYPDLGKDALVRSLSELQAIRLDQIAKLAV
jgi:hypothetical protein